MSTSRGDRRRRTRAAAGLGCLLLSACAVGPDFRQPPPPALDRYGDVAAAPMVELGRPVDAAWWRLFGSGKLDRLIESSLAASPTLASAAATLEESRDQARAGAGVFLPSLDVGFSAVRERATPLRQGASGPASTFSLYTLAGAVSYAIDLFGGERRGVEALYAEADRQRDAAGAAYLALTGNVADAAIARAGYADEAADLEEVVALEAAQRDILAAEARAGHAPLSVVLQAQQPLSADRQALAEARRRAAAATSLLNTLLGREQGQGAPAAPSLDELATPASVPVSLPSQLVRQRPDILQAEAATHQASAELGVATAALYPSISLTGDYGAAQTQLGRLGAPVARFWSIGPGVTVPIFQGGSLWYGRKAAEAGLARAQADYRQTVLAALEQVCDGIGALSADSETEAAARSASEAAELNRQLADANDQAGVIAGFDAMSARIAADRARMALAAARAQRLQDVVALYLASGGGWNGRDLGPSKPEAGR